MSKLFIPKPILALLLLLCSLAVRSQKAPVVSGNFQNLSFPLFAAEVEKSCRCRFFFSDTALDALYISAIAQEVPLDQLLDTLFVNTPYKYAFDAGGNVYITRNEALRTYLPKDFFSRSAQNNRATEARQDSANSPVGGAVPLITIGSGQPALRKQKATVAGYVRQKRTGEGIAGAIIYLDSSSTGMISDGSGFFSITMTPGRHTLRISATGVVETALDLQVLSDGRLNVEMEEKISSLRGVTVFASRNTNVRSVQMGVEKLSIATIKQVPALLGEVDVLRVVLALPGVTSVGEASTGFNVRGGSASQNLMLYDGATIYNPAHLFGFFAAFNPDMVKGVDLYKSFIPEKYGGRLSSVLDVSTREGSRKKISGNAGIGLLTSKLSLEGPLGSDKTTFLLGGRTTYSNWLLRRLRQSAYRNSEASFYDADLHLQHRLNDKNSLFLTGYVSNDGFKLNNDTAYTYGNRNFNLKWKHLFTNRFSLLATIGTDYYGYRVSSEADKVAAFEMSFAIRQKVLRTDFNYAPNNKHAISFGFHATAYHLEPGKLEPTGSASLVVPKEVKEERALESALYIGDQFTVSPKLSFTAGLRFSLYQYLGPKTQYNYIKDLPRSDNTVLDSAFFGKGKVVKTWMGPELRFSARYSLSQRASVKLGFNTLRQYIHMLSNTAAISPVDIWKLSDRYIKPQLGRQLSVGFYRNSRSNVVETSLELFYRRMEHFLDYKSGATLVLNPHVERDVFNAKGRAYGAELLLKKNSGKLNGWISYTYSRSLLQMDDGLAGEVINGGREYPADFDKPHIGNAVVNYRFSHRFSGSYNLVYSTGRPITLPTGVFELGGSRRLLYGDRNAHRVPDYFRMDLSFNLEGNHKVKQKTHNSWSFGVYNLLARKNVYSIYFVQEGGAIKGYQLSIFGTAIPFITFNIKF